MLAKGGCPSFLSLFLIILYKSTNTSFRKFKNVGFVKFCQANQAGKILDLIALIGWQRERGQEKHAPLASLILHSFISTRGLSNGIFLLVENTQFIESIFFYSEFDCRSYKLIKR
jgi:hypothetical protein